MIRGSKAEDFETGGREGFMTEGGDGFRTGSRVGFAQDGPGISDLMSSEYARGWHLTNLRFTSSSSRLRLGRTPENHITKLELETPKDFQKLDPIGARENSRRFLGVVDESKKTHLILIHFSEVFCKISIDSYAETWISYLNSILQKITAESKVPAKTRRKQSQSINEVGS